MQFNKIACVDNPGITDTYKAQVQSHSATPIQWIETYPTSNQEIIHNIGDADAALVSWNTVIDEKVIKACPNLKYIGMCCSLIDESSANVNIAAARARGIVVKGVRDYGDEGVIEYIISELIRLLKGFGKHQWKEDQVELGGQKLGIIGMGTTGKMLAEAALFFKMDVSYFSRTRKTEMEKKGCRYMPLDELLTNQEIISCHLPKHTKILTAEHFTILGRGKILINTALGLPCELDDLTHWLIDSNNYALMDASGMGIHSDELSSISNLIATPKVTGFTGEAKNRLSEKVIQNIEAYLAE